MEKFREKEQKYTAVREKLEYGVYHVTGQLEIEAYISREPLGFEDRYKGEFHRLKPGDHWGDLFDCGWFHFFGQLPREAGQGHIVVLVDASAEGLVVDHEGNPLQGLTSATSRNEFPLGLWGKRTIEMEDCSRDGVNMDFWVDFTCCDVEGQYRNEGRVKEACVAVVDDLCRDVFYDWTVCQSLYVGLCENGDAYGEAVGEILDQAAAVLNQPEGRESLKNLAPGGSAEKDTATEELLRERHACGKDVRALSQGLDASGERISLWPDPETDHTLKYQRTIDKEALIQIRTLLEKILKEKNPAPSMVYSAMGHSHLDLLFLWPERETRRKCARTLSTVVKMMDRFPEYRFCLSQAPVYLWMKEEYPSLYKRLRELIEEKRIEVTGAFWVECDTNLPCGESLVRQLLYGKRFFREEFGLDMKVGFLPDVFGYSAALPQLFAKSGVPYFTTNKLSMNDTNRFPRYTFWWHGLDGSRVLTHMLPENSYTSAAVPQMAIYGEYHHTDKDVSPEGLQLYGLGDGGGGPGYEHMERRRRTRNLKGCPTIRDEFIGDFFDRIAKNSAKYRKWDGELYFERHQGTYTSIARQKKWNRRLEQTLHTLEWLASLARARLGEPYPGPWLKQCWQDVMLYQFHDCLPGSAIGRVYEETQARYEELYRQAREKIEALKEKLAGCLDQRGMKEPMAVFNPISFRRTQRLEWEGREMTVTLEPYEIRAVDWSLAAAQEEREMGPAAHHVMENSFVRMEFAPDGTVVSLYDKREARELLPPGQRGNQLNLYPDRLTHWDIQKEYLQAEPRRARLTEMKQSRIGSCQRMELAFETGEKSRIRQTVVMEDYSARVDFRTWVDWQEEYQMLRVAWPVEAAAREAECDIQFGHIGRPVNHNTSWEEAKFEVCAHKWVDLSDADGGLALMNDCKYGYKVWDRILDLCLLRSQNCPCERGDAGEHEFTYSVYPHGPGLWESGVISEGYQLNYPLEEWRDESRKAGPAGEDPGAIPGTAGPEPWSLEALQGVVLETVKQAEAGDGFVLRFYETRGGRGEARIRLEGYEAAGLCTLLEELQPNQSSFERTSEGAKIHFRAFEVQSVLIKPLHRAVLEKGGTE